MVYYTCKRCGTELFSEDSVSHAGVRAVKSDTKTSESKNNAGNSSSGVEVSSVKESWGRNHETECTSVFLSAAPDWTDGHTISGNSGRLCCPNSKCGTRVGSYSWYGATCSCGKWITPSFQFQLARVDPVDRIDVSAIASRPTQRDVCLV